MPKFLEDKLKAEYGADSDIPYKVMNSIGAMRGNKTTAKGEAMQAKHERDMKAQRPRKPTGTGTHGMNWRSRWGQTKVNT